MNLKKLLAVLLLGFPLFALADPPDRTPSGVLPGKAQMHAIDVRDYPGVVGNGSNDDTAGIQLAVNAAVAAKRPLFFGPVSVRYKLTSEILVSGSLPGIFGTGMHPTSKSVIRQSVATKGAFIVRHGGAGSHSYTRFYDLRIEGTSNVTTAAADTKGIWFDSETIGAGPAVSFFDENDVERCYFSGFTWGIHAEKFSNSNLKHVVCEYIYNGVEIAGDNNNTVLLQNCFAGYVTNIAWRFNGTNTNCRMIACEGGGRAGNGAKAVVVTAGKLNLEGGNFEDFSGIRAPDTGDTTPGIIEAGLNGEIHVSDVTCLNGGGTINGYVYADALPFLARQFNGGGSCTRVRMLGFNAGLPTAKIYKAYSARFRFQPAPTNGGEGVWIYADHTFTGTPAKLREISCPTYHPLDVPAASQARSGEVFATYDDGGATPEQRWVVAKTGTATWANVLLTPPATSDFTVISGTSGALAVNTTYHSNNDATRTQRLLPLSANLGDEIKIYVYGAAGIRINQNAAAGNIMLPNGTTTTGSSAGYLTAEKGASFTLRCFFTSGGGYWLMVNASGTFAAF